MSESITIQHNGATLTVKPGTIGSALKRDQIIVALAQGDSGGDAIAHYQFARAASQTVIEGDLGWEPVTVGDSTATVCNKYRAWLDLPEDLGTKWMHAVHAVNTPQTPPEYQPEVGTDADPE